MAPTKGSLRGRIGTSANGGGAGARTGGKAVRDARDVLRGRDTATAGFRRNGAAGNGSHGGGQSSKRILKTAQGLVTNKKAKGISTAQLKNRQMGQSSSSGFSSGRPGAKPVGATIRNSAVIKSNPLLKSIVCVLMAVDDDSSSGQAAPPPAVAASASMPMSYAAAAASRRPPQMLPPQHPRSGQQQPTRASLNGGSSSDVIVQEDLNKNTMNQRSSVEDRTPLDAVGKQHGREEEFARIQQWINNEDALPGDDERAVTKQSTDLEQPKLNGNGHVETQGRIAGNEVPERNEHEINSDTASRNGNDNVSIDIEPPSSQDEKAAPFGSPRKEVNFDEGRNEVAVIDNKKDRKNPDTTDNNDSDWEDATDDEEAGSEDLDDFELPNTCQVLRAPNGTTVYLVGTAHFSRESQNDVRRVIRKVRPDRVMVELCKQRMHILTLDERLLFSEASKLSLTTIRETVRKMGYLQGAMFLLMMQLSAQLTNKLKVAPGGEFRVAYHEAKRLRGCQVFLGDRELNVTLRRAWASLGVRQRSHILWNLASSTEDISAEEVERCKERDMLEQLLGEMCADYPDLMRVLITERDLYLCRSLFDVAMGSKSGRPVVAAVGIGHQKGIVERWPNAADIRLRDLMLVPQAPLSVRVTGKLMRLGFWLTLGFVAYKVTPRAVKEGIARGVAQGLELGTSKLEAVVARATAIVGNKQ